MAYTTDRTWVAGEVVTAAYLNTYLRDNVKWLSTDKGMCRISNTVNQNHTTSGSAQSITFDTNTFDNASIHSTSSNTSRITVPTNHGGKWLVGGALGWAASALGNYRNSVVSHSAAGAIAKSLAPPSAATFSQTSVVALYSTAAATYFELQGEQDSGGTLAMLAAAFSLQAWAIWVGI